jgi:hypothetical protein
MVKTKSRVTSGSAKNIPASKSINVKKASNNGYILSQWSGEGKRLYIAKNQKDAQAKAAKLLKL